MDKENVVIVPFKDTKEVVSLGISIGKVFQAASADGKIDLSDIINPMVIAQLGSTFMLVKPALTDLTNVKLEFAIASEEERNEFELWVRTQVDLKDKTLEQFIEAAFALVLDFAYFLQLFFPSPLPVDEKISEPTADSVE